MIAIPGDCVSEPVCRALGEVVLAASRAARGGLRVAHHFAAVAPSPSHLLAFIDEWLRNIGIVGLNELDAVDTARAVIVDASRRTSARPTRAVQEGEAVTLRAPSPAFLAGRPCDVMHQEIVAALRGFV